MSKSSQQQGGEGDQRNGLSRRDMIRASVIAGAGAWTAPMIVGSLASPAAAVTVPAGLIRFQFTSSCGITAIPTDPTGADVACVPIGWATATNGAKNPTETDNFNDPNNPLLHLAPECITISGETAASCNSGFTLTMGYSGCADTCVFVSGAATVGGGNPCIQVLPTSGGKVITFPTPPAGDYVVFRITMSCT
jgi:hypothetical protein